MKLTYILITALIIGSLSNSKAQLMNFNTPFPFEILKFNKEGATRNSDSYNKLIYSLENEQLIKTGAQNFLEFDLSLSVVSGNQKSNPTYFAGTLVKIAYDKTMFGSNLKSNNKVIVSKADLLKDQATYNEPVITDFSENELNILLKIASPRTSKLNLVRLNEKPEAVLHLKFEITNCSGSHYIMPEIASPYLAHYADVSVNPQLPLKDYDAVVVSNKIILDDCIIRTSSPNSSHIQSVNIYPNPATNSLNLSFIDKVEVEMQLRISDSKGREIIKKLLLSNQKNETINISTLTNGIYTYRIESISASEIINQGKLVIIK